MCLSKNVKDEDLPPPDPRSTVPLQRQVGKTNDEMRESLQSRPPFQPSKPPGWVA